MAWIRSRPPALWLAIVAALGFLIALATAAPPAVTYRSNTPTTNPVSVPRDPAKAVCQTLVVLPKETRAVRLRVQPGAALPSRLTLTAGDGSLARTTLGPPTLVDGGRRVVYRLPRAVESTSLGAELCLYATQPNTKVIGWQKDVNVDLLGAERGSWLEALPLLAERAVWGRSIVGSAALPLAFLLLIGAWVLVVRVAPRSRDAVVDRRAITRVALVAVMLSSAYAITTPPLEAPDEMVHLHYADVLRTQHHVPTATATGAMGSQVEHLVAESRVSEVAFQPSHRPPWTKAEDRSAAAQFAKLPTDDAPDVFTNASSQPPGYYAVGAVASSVLGGGAVDRMLTMRLISALLMGIAAAGAVVFARAAVPSAGGFVLAGGIAFATLPIVTFIGGSVNPDAAYTAAAAWLLAGLATVLRHGLTTRRAIWIGAATMLGMVSKLTFLPLLPAVAATALVVLVREIRAGRGRQALRPLGIALGMVLAVGVPFYAWATLSGRGVVFGPPGGAPAPAVPWRDLVGYAFELYVGQVGPILDRIAGSGPHIFIDGFVGNLGWLDYGLPPAWNVRFEYYWLALAALAAFAVLRSIVRRRRGTALLEAALWVLAAVPVLLVIAKSGLETRYAGGSGFEQARYLFPLAAFGVAGLALAIRQFPQRIGGIVAAVVVTISVAQATTLWMVTIGRYFA
ncbi:MAG: DUF2142 domain-containing protein [Patulibacter minatonensis]